MTKTATRNARSTVSTDTPVRTQREVQIQDLSTFPIPIAEIEGGFKIVRFKDRQGRTKKIPLAKTYVTRDHETLFNILHNAGARIPMYDSGKKDYIRMLMNYSDPDLQEITF